MANCGAQRFAVTPSKIALFPATAKITASSILKGTTERAAAAGTFQIGALLIWDCEAMNGDEAREWARSDSPWISAVTPVQRSDSMLTDSGAF